MYKIYQIPDSNHPTTLKILWETCFRINPKLAEKQYAQWQAESHGIVSYYPSRVLVQDFTGIPLVVDLATLRDAAKTAGKDPAKVNPTIPVDMVIDHSVIVDRYGTTDAVHFNTTKEFQRNSERYAFLKWAQKSLKNFRLVPPGKGICHQINIEYLAPVVNRCGDFLYSDSCIGTDSHTTMAGALGVLAWGVGGIEAEAAMLGLPIDMVVPKVIGFELTGALRPGTTATDLVLTITNKIRGFNAVGKFVEFIGSGVESLPLEHRATISNMAPEYGATCGFFHIDQTTLDYLYNTGRSQEEINYIKKYIALSGMGYNPNSQYDYKITLDLDSIYPSVAGPSRPQDILPVDKIMESAPVTGKPGINDGAVAIAAITSCTNTSNPYLILQAALVAKKACELGIKPHSYVKTSFGPGSQAVSGYLKKLKLDIYLNQIGFNVVGYGCTTCIGNSGNLSDEISEFLRHNKVSLCSILSGNRNFQGRIHPNIQSNFLASPAMVIIFALAGHIGLNVLKDPIAQVNNKNIYFRDLWPQDIEISEMLNTLDIRQIYLDEYRTVFEGTNEWKKLQIAKSLHYKWDPESSYIKRMAILDNESSYKPFKNARALAVLGDSITTDHISPAGKIPPDSPAGIYLTQIGQNEFNSYGARRGNHEVMIRGGFANIRLRNLLVEQEGGYTYHFPTDTVTTIYDASCMYSQSNTDLVVIAGHEYGTGSSRDWAAKATRMLNIKAVIAKSFERIHRANLVGVGVLPLEIDNNNYKFKGNEEFSIEGEPGILNSVKLVVKSNDETVKLNCKALIQTQAELDAFRVGGLLHYFLYKI